MNDIEVVIIVHERLLLFQAKTEWSLEVLILDCLFI